MSLEQKYVLFQGLMRTVRKAKEAGVRMQHPEWDDEKVEKELASIYIRSTTQPLETSAFLYCKLATDDFKLTGDC